MTGSLNEMLAKEHVRDLLAKAEAERRSAGLRADPSWARQALAGLLRRGGRHRTCGGSVTAAAVTHSPVARR